jgi:hypothetical protein
VEDQPLNIAHQPRIAIPVPCATESTGRVNHHYVAWCLGRSALKTLDRGEQSTEAGAEDNDLARAAILDGSMDVSAALDPWVLQHELFALLSVGELC